MGTPSFIRLVKAEGALRLPSADGDDLDFSAADWDPLSLECPDYNDPNYAKSACGVIQGRALSTNEPAWPQRGRRRAPPPRSLLLRAIQPRSAPA